MKTLLAVIILSSLLLEICSLPKTKNQILYQRLQKKRHDYQFEYAAEDGSRRQETGTFVYKDNATEPVLHVKGSYEYRAGGRKFLVRYEADEQGMRQEGDVVPVQTDAGTEKSVKS